MAISASLPLGMETFPSESMVAHRFFANLPTAASARSEESAPMRFPYSNPGR